MKLIPTLLMAALLAGCSAPFVRQKDRTRALTWTTAAPMERAWQAATNAAGQHPLSIVKIDSANRFIATGTPARGGSDGELIGLWLSRCPEGTRIEVSSKAISLLAFGNTDWRHPVAQRICAALGEPVPAEPAREVPRTKSPRGK